MREFHLQIVTPDGEVYSGMAEAVRIRCDGGDVEIMAGHADLFASLGIGETRLKIGEHDRFASSAGGFISVKGGNVKIVATTFEFSEDIDLKRAEAAKEQAEEKMRQAQDERAYKIASAKLARALNRISVKNRG